MQRATVLASATIHVGDLVRAHSAAIAHLRRGGASATIADTVTALPCWK
jgi:hypothetical protein